MTTGIPSGQSYTNIPPANSEALQNMRRLNNGETSGMTQILPDGANVIEGSVVSGAENISEEMKQRIEAMKAEAATGNSSPNLVGEPQQAKDLKEMSEQLKEMLKNRTDASGQTLQQLEKMSNPLVFPDKNWECLPE